MSRRGGGAWTLSEAVGAVTVAVVALAAAAVVVLSLAGCEATVIVEPDANGWPESAEFSALDTGQTRFSSHSCGDLGGAIVVDHATGVQYLMTAGGLCPLLDADGSPLLVAEAGE